MRIDFFEHDGQQFNIIVFNPIRLRGGSRVLEEYFVWMYVCLTDRNLIGVSEQNVQFATAEEAHDAAIAQILGL